MSTGYPFEDVVTSVEALRELIAEPNELALRKEVDHLDEHARAYIALSPFLLMATSGAGGTCDVSPKGDGPGFVQVLDDRTLVIPDRPGNRRLDSLRNIIENPHVGLLFLIPGTEETLRVNGRARIVRDAAVLERCSAGGKTPLLAIAVEADEVFLHCPKCFKRSHLWDTATWPPRSALPSYAQMLKDYTKIDAPLADVEKALAESHKKLW
jgi:uncharacterized protein